MLGFVEEVDEDELTRRWVQAPPTVELSPALSVARQDTMLTSAQTVQPKLNLPDLSKPLIYDLYDFQPQSSEIPIHDLNLLFPNCPDSDKDSLQYLSNIQREIFETYKLPMNSIHSAQSILFFKNTLQANDLVLNTLRFGYRPG